MDFKVSIKAALFFNEMEQIRRTFSTEIYQYIIQIEIEYKIELFYLNKIGKGVSKNWNVSYLYMFHATLALFYS